MESSDLLYITIAAGELVEDTVWDYGEVVTIASGGKVSNVELTHRASSLTVEAGAVVSGSLTVASNVTVDAAADLSEADVVWNIAQRKKESGLLWSDIGSVDVNSLTLTVSPDQNKGTYLLAGNAAGLDITIAVVSSSGSELGTLSLASSVLNVDITRYTLEVNDKGELCVTVSSNIDDDSYYVFLYKDNHLVRPLKEAMALEVSGSGQYDHLIITEQGWAGNIIMQSGGLVTLYQGALAVGIEQLSGSKLRFDYTAGDSTVISGVNQYGTFFVQNNKLVNVYGENVTLSGDLDVVNYYSCGVLTTGDGVDITGTLKGGSRATFKNGTTIHDCSVSGSNLTFESGVTVTNTTISGGSNYYFRGVSVTDVTISGSSIDFYDSTLANVTISGNWIDFYELSCSDITISGSGIYLYGGTYSNLVLNGTASLSRNVTLGGTLTVNGTISGSGSIDAAGNVIVLNYTNRTIANGCIINGAKVSAEAVFYVDLLADQVMGPYNILSYGRDDYSFVIRIDGKIIGTLTNGNDSFEYGNFSYTLTGGKDLAIDVSENADETFNVIFWRNDGTIGHASDLFTAVTGTGGYKQIEVRKGGRVGDVTVSSGGLLYLHNGGYAVGLVQQSGGSLRFDYAAGDVTTVSGINQYGMFLVQNNQLINVVGENVTLSGALAVQNYRSTGKLTVRNGVSFTGILDTGSQSAIFSGKDDALVSITNATISGSSKTFNAGVVITDAEISGGTTFNGGVYTNVTVNGSSNNFKGGTFSNAIWRGGSISGNIELAGTLTITGNISRSSGAITAHNNTIVLDYTGRTEGSGAIISLNAFAKENSQARNFQIELKDNQAMGTYTIVSGADSFSDNFYISVAGSVIGTLTSENSSFEYGNCSYTMNWNSSSKNITLSIGVSENADERFNVLCYDSANKLSYASEMTDLVVDGSNCAKVTVRSGGWLANAKLRSGSISIRQGANVYGLEQSASGQLNFDYAAGDTTIISGVNQYGTFFVQDDRLVNVVGQNVTVKGNVLVESYHCNGSFSGDGITVIGNFYGSGTFKNSTIKDSTISGSATVSGNSNVSNVVFRDVTINGGYIDTVTINGSATLNAGTYSDIILNGKTSVRGYTVLDGSLAINNTVDCVNSYSVNGYIDAAGNEVTINLTTHTTESGAVINLDRLYNADLVLTVYDDQTLGTYAVGTNAGKIGQGDGEATWNSETNSWVYHSVQGDLDGVITILSEQGIELARCTVNGNTEYCGRYNYRVYVDEYNVLQLRIGWNNRGDIIYADDGYKNDIKEDAIVIDGTGIQTYSGMTIHNNDDVDWYKFTLARSGTAANYIRIEFKQWAGDLDFELYDVNGKLIDYAQSVTDNEELSLRGLDAGEYYVKVYGDVGHTNAYTLVANLPAVLNVNDEYEKGNTAEDAYNLGAVSSDKSVKSAIAEAGDDDYYSFYLERTGTALDAITLTFDPELGDLDLYLYDQSGTRLLGSSSLVNTDREEISLQGLGKGRYTVKVAAKNGLDLVDYDLNFTISSLEIEEGDKYENNDTLKKAKNLNALHGHNQNKNLSIHNANDVDYFKFKLKETGSVADYIAINYEFVPGGDIDIELLDAKGNVVAYSRTAENTDRISLEGVKAGDYYIRIYGYNNSVNTYSIEYNVNNVSVVDSDVYEGVEYSNGGFINIRQDQTITHLSIAEEKYDDDTTDDVFKISLEYDAWRSSKVIFTDYRPDWNGLSYVLKNANGEEVAHGVGSEICLTGLSKGEYELVVSSPEEGQYGEYSVTFEGMPDHQKQSSDNKWSIFIYMAGDNNLDDAYLKELEYMHQRPLPAGVEVYILFDRAEQGDWSGTRVCKVVYENGYTDYIEWMQLGDRDEWDTGSVETLEAFLDWGMEVGSAENYALIMKDHGTSLGFNSKDETDESLMSINDIADLLKKAKYEDLSLVAFDQCQMGSDVVITAMEGVVDYVVASEATGYTPNQLVQYGVLFKSLTANMTTQELAQKIVSSLNTSQKYSMTMAAFDTSEAYLSTALNKFSATSSDFTYEDWSALCNAFKTATNYGNEICAFSDLISILENVLSASGISDTLRNAANTLIAEVNEYVIKDSTAVPVTYGNGLAVFNPVLSSSQMNQYAYSYGNNLDYYSSSIGATEWGVLLYKVGKLAGAVSDYIQEDNSVLTFENFTYYYVGDNKEVFINLGAYSGDGLNLEGLYVAERARFSIEIFQAHQGDNICIAARNPNANITVSLEQVTVTESGEERTVLLSSSNGTLALDGIDFGSMKYSDYEIVISTDQATSYDMIFNADWTTGVDRFDFARTGTIDSSFGGNNILDKSTILDAGVYTGLMTYKGDADYYKLTTVFTNYLDVTITGDGLIVKEFNAAGEVIQVAAAANGQYILRVKNGNYLYIEGMADISANEVNSYKLEISDVASAYIAPDLSETVAPPTITINADTETPAIELIVTATVAENVKTYYTSNINDEESWIEFSGSTVLRANGRYYFKAFDTVSGLESTSYQILNVENIDLIAPVLSITIEPDDWYNGTVVLTAVTDDNEAVIYCKKSTDEEFVRYTESMNVDENAIYVFYAEDILGNKSEEQSIVVSNIDKVAPTIAITGNPLEWINSDCVLTAQYSDDWSGIESIKYFDGQDWVDGDSLRVTENGEYQFMAIDKAGNVATKSVVVDKIDKLAPAVPDGLEYTVVIDSVFMDWTDAIDVNSGVCGYMVRYGTTEQLDGEGEFVAASEFSLADLWAGNYYYQVKSLDNAGNVSEWSEVQSFCVTALRVRNLQGDKNGLSWDAVPDVTGYIVEYSTDNFASVITLETSGTHIDFISLPAGRYQWRIRAIGGDVISNGKDITVAKGSSAPKIIVSTADDNPDVFLANVKGKWREGYIAEHKGSCDDWSGTNEQVSVMGKNKLTDILVGSADANILFLTDDDNGDALFVDDIFSAFPDQGEAQARIAAIDEIRAGAGDDVVDLTSQQFKYVGGGVTVYGGAGDDTIWANSGENTLFGDAGHDRIVGGAGNDHIVGGAGNDSMHGGGGIDTFYFGGNWGKDTVEQLDGG